MLDQLEEVIRRRMVDAPPESYTGRLLTAGVPEIAKKVGEEAIEVVLAASAQSNPRLVEETADLLYHLTVLLVACDLGWKDVWRELARRRG